MAAIFPYLPQIFVVGFIIVEQHILRYYLLFM
jgi:hypothetical protein